MKTVKCLILPILHKPLDITYDEFSDKVVEGKLLKFSLPNKITIVIFNRHLMQSSFGGKIGLCSAAPL